MSFGPFEVLTQYGVLGFAVLGLGYLCWTFLNRLMKSEDELKAKVEELEDEFREGYEKTINESTEEAKSLKEMIMIFLSKKR
jgi:Tfp pilus assembly protein PilO